ncbi:hypothetical protein ACH4TQ_15005 [Streptomyces sp. NPDC021218]|uniref:hypothetical protein n=1 Tax=Streptomyces sp. NPDC021218 TaxID=3365119 RepID=UPI00378AA24D
MSGSVQWGGQWEHPACGATGEQTWADEDTVFSQHDCGRGGEVTWHAEWHCDECGASGDDLFGDDTVTYSDHDCGDDLEEAA